MDFIKELKNKVKEFEKFEKFENAYSRKFDELNDALSLINVGVFMEVYNDEDLKTFIDDFYNAREKVKEFFNIVEKKK